MHKHSFTSTFQLLHTKTIVLYMNSELSQKCIGLLLSTLEIAIATGSMIFALRIQKDHVEEQNRSKKWTQSILNTIAKQKIFICLIKHSKCVNIRVHRAFVFGPSQLQQTKRFSMHRDIQAKLYFICLLRSRTIADEHIHAYAPQMVLRHTCRIFASVINELKKKNEKKTQSQKHEKIHNFSLRNTTKCD